MSASRVLLTLTPTQSVDVELRIAPMGTSARQREAAKAVKAWTVDELSVREAAVRLTAASAAIEQRVVPANFVRSPRVERFLAARREAR